MAARDSRWRAHAARVGAGAARGDRGIEVGQGRLQLGDPRPEVGLRGRCEIVEAGPDVVDGGLQLGQAG